MAKYRITLDDFEHRVVVKAMNEQRNTMLNENKPTELFDNVYKKIISADSKGKIR